MPAQPRPFRTFALPATAGLLLLASAAQAAGQDSAFPADAAIEIGTDEVSAMADACAENVDGEGLSRDDVCSMPRVFTPRYADMYSRRPQPALELTRQELIPVGPFIRTCECSSVKTVFVDDIRDISDQFSADGNAESSAGLSNMVWGFGQFLDHDLALSIEDESSATIDVETDTDVMELHRSVTTNRAGCKNNLNVHTPLVDAGPVYGSDRAYLRSTLRAPASCRLRAAEGDFLPVTTSADANGMFSFIAGDVRVSEHAFLAAQHTVWLREHNRLCEVVDATARYDNMNADQKFDLVRNVVIAKIQEVVLKEFLPALGISQADLEGAKPLTNRNGISVEFSIAYRLGHDLIGNNIGGIDFADTFGSERVLLDVSGPPSAPSVKYKPNANSLISNIMLQLSTTRANEIDGRLSDALRNFLFGRDQGEDLAGRNIFRGRDLGLPTYGGLAKCFGLKPDATVEAETPDAWLGLLREPKAAKGDPLPPTLRAIMIEQFHRIFFGRRGRYWRNRLRKVGGFAEEIESGSYATVISANTGARVSGNVFKA